MVSRNLIVGYHDLHIVVKAYVNIVNAISTFVEPISSTNIIKNETILTQYSTKQALKVWKKSEASVRKYLQQFHNCRVFNPKNPQYLRYEQQSKILAYLVLIKLKNDEVKIKIRECADERKQQNRLSKYDKSLPTVSTEGLMI